MLPILGSLFTFLCFNLHFFHIQFTYICSYSVDRSSQLRCLYVEECVTAEIDVTDVVKRLPLLEELHLIMGPMLSPKDFETISISCPMLKSFTYFNKWRGYPEFTEHAVAIGKNMPNLRHLRLFSHKIENKGLEAILDGCTGLETLHLRECSGLDLQGSLGKRCSDQIKDFILHSESCQSEHDSESSHESEGDYADSDWDDDDDSSNDNLSQGNFYDSGYEYDLADFVKIQDFDGYY